MYFNEIGNVYSIPNANSYFTKLIATLLLLTYLTIYTLLDTTKSCSTVNNGWSYHTRWYLT